MKNRIKFFEDFERTSSSMSLYDNIYGEKEETGHERMKRILLSGIKNLLTKRQRICFEAYYFEGKSVKEIARELGISGWGVYKHLESGMQSLKSCTDYF